ncbi:TPA: AAA family ATPase [Pseudomonas aeruginosa]|uniref:replicative DNA helicase n=1 Tax=Pseudomonas aeruginosa TaxID=287 RepID=UPI0021F1B2E3|nr:DnaB-like helicase C-terminal domain-containing protein [Pseudomonas aeruginosa]MCO3956654.1 replicative DNA helicase [Pseudomonas aeruginosa]MCV6327801.1 AAA family ATPase [Pseudomonas aeruginosa]HBO6199145.1 AAA family ATPase [Pseudomonas aeruginosa]HCE7517913.1 AAA family ATPase [Pseudomonas aeruginosa]HCE7644957.1 AAA family ATPase [Pseudomonas aeruginosa]
MSRELYSEEAEFGVLGAILQSALQQNQELVDEALSSVTAADFYFEDNAALFQAIKDCYEEGIPVDPVTVGVVRDVLPSGAKLIPYAGNIARNVPSVANWRTYVRHVRERAILRCLIDTAESVKASATDDRPLPEIIARAQQAMADLRDLDDEAPKYKRLDEVMLKAVDVIDDKFNGRAPQWPGTGLADLDKLVRGIRPRKLTVIAGLPGNGKTTLALQIAQYNACEAGEPWLVFSLEMPEEELGVRSIASLGGVDLKRLDDPQQLGDDDWPRITSAVAKAKGAPLFICDDPNVTASQIRSTARCVKREHGLAGIVVDYLGLIPPEAKGRTRSEEVGKTNKSLLRLAKELGVPVIELAQLNRDSTKRPGKRPQSSDLRDSGEIEADASCILMVHRDMDSEAGQNGITEILMTKCRHAPPGMCLLQQQGMYGRFVNFAGPREMSQEEVEMGRSYFANKHGKKKGKAA